MSAADGSVGPGETPRVGIKIMQIQGSSVSRGANHEDCTSLPERTGLTQPLFALIVLLLSRAGRFG